MLDEYTLAAIERNTPIALSALAADEAGRPVLDGSRVYWHQDEVTASGATGQVHDPYSIRFPSSARLERDFEPTPRQLFEGEGDQRNIVVDQGEIAWVVQREGESRVEYCPKPKRRSKCEPVAVTEAPGRMSRPFLKKGWLVWARTHEDEAFIEGCRVGRRDGLCEAEP